MNRRSWRGDTTTSPPTAPPVFVVYGGKFAYSHHATDPVCGRLLNAFDLVRLHKFGNLEEKSLFGPCPDFAVKDILSKPNLPKNANQSPG